MKILQLVTKRQHRGAEVFASVLSKELIKRKHQIIFAGLYKNTDDELKVDCAKNIDLSGKKNKFISIPLLISLIKLIKKENPNIIHCNGSDTVKYAVLASLFTKKRPVVYRNISVISKWMNGNLLKKIFNKFIFKNVDFVTNVGEFTRIDFVKTLKFPDERTQTIYRGIPPKIFDKNLMRKKLTQELKIPENHKIILHAGNFSPEKNHKFLLQVFKKLNRDDVHLVLAGTGILFEEIKKEARNLKNIRFLGFRNDLAQLLSAADLFVLTSKIEGVPGVIIEAGFQKTVSISTNVGGVNEVIKNNETGFIIDDFKATEFIKKINLLLNDSNKRRKMSENAYFYTRKKFNIQKTTEDFEKLFVKLINEKN